MENRSGLGQTQYQAKVGAMRINPDLLKWVGGRDGKPFPFAGSSRVTEWSTCNLFYSRICVFPRVLITSANWLHCSTMRALRLSE